MRISDWSSDVCSSDLTASTALNLGATNDSAIDDGFNLVTSGNGNIVAGTSMLIQVPGHYRMAAGGKAAWTSQQVKDLPAGVNISNNAGVVIQNFEGLKMEAVEGVTVNQ